MRVSSVGNDFLEHQSQPNETISRQQQPVILQDDFPLVLSSLSPDTSRESTPADTVISPPPLSPLQLKWGNVCPPGRWLFHERWATPWHRTRDRTRVTLILAEKFLFLLTKSFLPGVPGMGPTRLTGPWKAAVGLSYPASDAGSGLQGRFS